MNDIIQITLVAIIMSYATWFLVRKFIWKQKRKSSGACGKDGCGCH